MRHKIHLKVPHLMVPHLRVLLMVLLMALRWILTRRGTSSRMLMRTVMWRMRSLKKTIRIIKPMSRVKTMMLLTVEMMWRVGTMLKRDLMS